VIGDHVNYVRLGDEGGKTGNVVLMKIAGKQDGPTLGTTPKKREGCLRDLQVLKRQKLNTGGMRNRDSKDAREGER